MVSLDSLVSIVLLGDEILSRCHLLGFICFVTVRLEHNFSHRIHDGASLALIPSFYSFILVLLQVINLFSVVSSTSPTELIAAYFYLIRWYASSWIELFILSDSCDSK